MCCIHCEYKIICCLLVQHDHNIHKFHVSAIIDSCLKRVDTIIKVYKGL